MMTAWYSDTDAAAFGGDKAAACVNKDHGLDAVVAAAQRTLAQRAGAPPVRRDVRFEVR